MTKQEESNDYQEVNNSDKNDDGTVPKQVLSSEPNSGNLNIDSDTNNKLDKLIAKTQQSVQDVDESLNEAVRSAQSV